VDQAEGITQITCRGILTQRAERSADDMPTTSQQIKCYGSSKVVNGWFGIMAAYPAVMLVITVANGRFFQVWPALLFAAFALWLWWHASRRGTYIAVDQRTRRIFGSNLFIRSRDIPIDAITGISTRQIFAGLATETEVTYRKSNGRQKTVGYGTTNFLDHVCLRRILDAIVAMNPKLRIPPELISHLEKES
jgi:hypothetical protein